MYVSLFLIQRHSHLTKAATSIVGNNGMLKTRSWIPESEEILSVLAEIMFVTATSVWASRTWIFPAFDLCSSSTFQTAFLDSHKEKYKEKGPRYCLAGGRAKQKHLFSDHQHVGQITLCSLPTFPQKSALLYSSQTQLLSHSKRKKKHHGATWKLLYHNCHGGKIWHFQNQVYSLL